MLYVVIFNLYKRFIIKHLTDDGHWKVQETHIATVECCTQAQWS